MTNDLAALSEALAWTTEKCPNAPYVAVKREIVERLVSGDLVLIDREGMRERVARAIDLALAERPDGRPHWHTTGDLADAAIAAILGEKP